MLTEDEVIDKAREIRQHIEDAVSDVAYEGVEFLGEKWRDKIISMERDGVVDIRGALADNMYNDADTLSSLSGDRIHDAANGDWADMVRIAVEIRDDGHEPLQKVMDKFIARYRKLLKQTEGGKGND